MVSSVELITLLENRLIVPVVEALGTDFSNRYTAAETKSLGLRHRVKQPVPKALVKQKY